jgi:hypothetical protein
MIITLIGRRVRVKQSAGHPIDDRLGAIRSIHRSYRESGIRYGVVLDASETFLKLRPDDLVVVAETDDPR